MAISCPGCGRQYDVTLFPFGRTIHCTCGRRVGLRHEIGPEPGEGPPRFFADAMLGRLARWLRTLGWDTAFDDAIADEELVHRSLEEARCILTRDAGILEEWRVGNVLLVEAERPLEQLREVVSALGLPRPRRLFTRCRMCNSPLRRAAPEEVAAKVPERVRRRAADFRRCPNCGRVYWEGSHTERMRKVVDRIFEAG